MRYPNPFDTRMVISRARASLPRVCLFQRARRPLQQLTKEASGDDETTDEPAAGSVDSAAALVAIRGLHVQVVAGPERMMTRDEVLLIDNLPFIDGRGRQLSEVEAEPPASTTLPALGESVPSRVPHAGPTPFALGRHALARQTVRPSSPLA